MVVLVALGGLAGCSSDDDSQKAENTAPAERTLTDRPRAEGKGKPTEGKRAPEESKAQADRRKARDRQQAAREQKALEKEDREFDRSFRETPFEKLTGRLPIREAPLFVEQYITDDSSKLQAAVNEKRFLCKTTPGERKKAVEAFYKDAVDLFDRGGVKDLELSVAPVTETAGDVPALATAKSGRVSLTARGRGRGPC